jgi:hypothetical protein
MKNTLRILFVASVGAGMVACSSDNSTSPVGTSAAAAALITAPLSFDQINTSFVGSSDPAQGFAPGDEQGGPGGAEQNRWGPGWHELMGGGIGESFIGGIGFGAGFGHGPFGDWHDSDDCAFSTTTNRLDCSGLTTTRSYSFLDAAGAVQQAFAFGTTNTVNVKTAVSGTVVHHDGEDTSVVNSSSDFTVAGLASGSTQRTVNGLSAGTESTTGIKHDSAFKATRTAGDTINGLVIPIQDGHRTFPTAGTVIRGMQAIVTFAGQSPSTSTRREVITYDGSSTAKIVITHDGVVKNCTKPLPHGPLSCS